MSKEAEEEVAGWKQRAASANAQLESARKVADASKIEAAGLKHQLSLEAAKAAEATEAVTAAKAELQQAVSVKQQALDEQCFKAKELLSDNQKLAKELQAAREEAEKLRNAGLLPKCFGRIC